MTERDKKLLVVFAFVVALGVLGIWLPKARVAWEMAQMDLERSRTQLERERAACERSKEFISAFRRFNRVLRHFSQIEHSHEHGVDHHAEHGVESEFHAACGRGVYVCNVDIVGMRDLFIGYRLHAYGNRH